MVLPAFSELSIALEVDQVLAAWRGRVLQILLVFSSAAMLLPLGAVLAGYGLRLPALLRGATLVLYLALLLATLRPRWRLAVRAWLLLGAIAATGAIELSVGQLAGSGRISLLLLPLLALLLVGPRAGWAAAGLSAILFALVPALLHSGWLEGCRIALAGTAAPPAYWALQWFLWLSILLTLMILFTHFQSLQRRTMIDERKGRRQREAETADRRRLEEAIGRIGEEERRRLGAELHDGLCQHLTAARLNCSALEAAYGAAEAGGPSALAQLRQTLEEALGMAYDVANGLCPVDMEPDALLPALERLCREVRERHGIACRLQADRNLAIHNPEHALHLYRIAREAVANAVKHARCHNVAIALEQGDGELVLRIGDDGQGAGTGAAPKAGLGLSIMAYRAKLIGGALQIGESATGGMQVACRVPGLAAAP